MAHECPKCGQLCHCRGDIDDIDFEMRYDCDCCSEYDEFEEEEEDEDCGPYIDTENAIY